MNERDREISGIEAFRLFVVGYIDRISTKHPEQDVIARDPESVQEYMDELGLTAEEVASVLKGVRVQAPFEECSGALQELIRNAYGETLDRSTDREITVAVSRRLASIKLQSELIDRDVDSFQEVINPGIKLFLHTNQLLGGESGFLLYGPSSYAQLVADLANQDPSRLQKTYRPAQPQELQGIVSLLESFEDSAAITKMDFSS